MSGLFPEYENDIFISYRQNDNINDGWVTDFVDNLRRELQSVVKEKLSIYFDINPFDGIVETDDVDKSLGSKLKSLIFIPVLSRTYCDINSYAWQNEFLQFNEMIKKDRYGRNLIQRNGNVVSRILPVRIHELEPSDIKLIQEKLEGQLRAIDFCYRGSGVNRPLRPEDTEDGNFFRLVYRNQLNKLANAIAEIIHSFKSYGHSSFSQSDFANFGQLFSPAKSIAVLPFVNMSNDPEQDYFSDGISEEIINTLVQMPDLKVAGRTSSFSFKNKNEDLRSIGEKLNVTTILEGSVRKSGNRVRVTAQLIEVSTGFHLWSRKFDRDLNDIFVIQDEIAGAIVESLQLALSGQPLKKKERPQTQNVEAYQLYLKGMALFYKRGLHMFDGLECFKEALKIDPDYALALVGLADSYTMLCLHSFLPPEECWPKAAKAAEYALIIEPDLAEAHNAAGIIAELFEWNWTKAESEFLKALELKPAYLQARCWFAFFYLMYVRHDLDEAIRHARIAVENDTLSSYGHGILGIILSQAGFHIEAVEEGNKGIDLDKNSFSAWHISAKCDLEAGNIEIAKQKLRHALDISGRHNWALMILLNILAESTDQNDIASAGHLYMELLAKSKTGYVSPSILAVASANLGKNDESVRFFRDAIDRHDPFILNTLNLHTSNTAFFSIHEITEMLNSIGLYPFSVHSPSAIQ